MATEREKTFIDFIKMVSPGTSLRSVINDIIRSGLGVMIIFDTKKLSEYNMLDIGFRVNSRFTPQKLFELSKMDGAIVVSQDLKRILYANVLVNPSNTIHSSETGIRHRSAERAAKQANTFIIAISERRKKTTLYFGSSKYYLKTTDEIIRNISSTLQVLEKQKEMLVEHVSSLNILEMSDLISVGDACKVIQRAEMISKISESVKRNFTELGKDGVIMHMRYRELLRGVEKIESGVLRDYSNVPLKRSKTILSNLTFEGLLDTESIARLVIGKQISDSVSPKGYRFLSHLTLSVKEISQFVRTYNNLENILKLDSKDFEQIVKNRSQLIYEEIRHLREQILSGKVTC